MADDAHPDREPTVEIGARQEHTPRRVDPLEQLASLLLTAIDTRRDSKTTVESRGVSGRSRPWIVASDS
jgi:hypothetical protein